MPDEGNTRRVVDAIEASGVLAILRGDFSAHLPELLDAIYEAGVRAVEISLSSPGATAQLERLAVLASGRFAVGAGTVLSRADLARALQHGAEFIVAPNTDPEVIAAAQEAGVFVCPGAFTPTEVLAAARLGSHAVKVFPADSAGPALVGAVLAAVPGLRLVPTGGVTLDLARAFARAGAWAVGVGGPLVGRAEAFDPIAIRTRARAFVTAMRESSPAAGAPLGSSSAPLKPEA